MLEAHKLQIANLLNGVPVAEVARLAGEPEAEVLGRFLDVMKRIGEYQLVHCVPHFPCGTLPAAMRHRIEVLHILGAVERWDAVERDAVLDFLKGKRASESTLPRAELLAVLQRTLDALPNYLEKHQLAAFLRGADAFVKNNRSAVIAAVEKFVSLRNPLTYNKIEHVGMSAENALAVAGSITH